MKLSRKRPDFEKPSRDRGPQPRTLYSSLIISTSYQKVGDLFCSVHISGLLQCVQKIFHPIVQYLLIRSYISGLSFCFWAPKNMESEHLHRNFPFIFRGYSPEP